jgi:hypothetical protein
MIRINYDENGRVSGLPLRIPTSGTVPIEIYAEHLNLSEDDDLELKLSLLEPVPISGGTLVFGYGGDSTPAVASEACSEYMVETLLNGLTSITSAGGVRVYGGAIRFNDSGARTAISVTHSSLGELSGRVPVLVAGAESVKAIYGLDLTIQSLVAVTVAVDAVEGDVTVEEITEGTTTAAQRDRITINRPPAYGKMRLGIDDESSMWLPATASGYQVEMAIEAVTPGFLVSKTTQGQSVIFDIARDAVGVNDAVTVEDTFVWPSGVAMDLDLSNLSALLNMARVEVDSSGEVYATLSFDREGKRQFSETVILAPFLQPAGPII